MNSGTVKTPEEEAMDRAYEIMSEFFPAFVIVADKRTPSKSGIEGETKQSLLLSWYGGKYSAVGILECAKNHMINNGSADEDENPEDSE